MLQKHTSEVQQIPEQVGELDTATGVPKGAFSRVSELSGGLLRSGYPLRLVQSTGR